MSYVFRWFFRFAILLFLCFPALAEESKPLRGVALVIGQSDYQHLAKLNNTTNDARKIETLLNSLGFSTDVATDRNAKKLRRDLEGFAEDAEDADVALVYYSGHGIEAGGENFIIPLDADISALDSADEQLISLSGFLATLRAKAKITIVLLDACRNNPFPPGSVLKQAGAQVAVEVSNGGLAVFRGAGAENTEDGDEASLGEVIGYAAAPGQAALDGVPGANSPYATALLKHLSSKGLDFGQVMTLVSQEVYLNTKGQQLPWTNTSLQQFLSFGQNPEDDSSDEALIRGERRQLLLTIAATPIELRDTVQALAKKDDVPLDALFAMLKTLEVDTKGDGAQLENQLRAGAAKLKTFMAERSLLKSVDPEIMKYSKLADDALAEGAFKTATIFHEKAKQRVASLEANVGQVETELKAKRLEFGAVYASSAETRELAFQHKEAASDWKNAFVQVAKWDEELAYTYKAREATALLLHGDYKGDNLGLMRAIEVYREALTLVPFERFPDKWADMQNDLGNALSILGGREIGNARLLEALVEVEKTTKVWTRDKQPEKWAMAQHTTGNIYLSIGDRTSDVENYRNAGNRFLAMLEVQNIDEQPYAWAATSHNLGVALELVGRRTGETETLELAIEIYKESLAIRTEANYPDEWAMTNAALANILQHVGSREEDSARLKESVDLYRNVLRVNTKERLPIEWARTMNGLGSSLQTLGVRSGDDAMVLQAIDAYRQSLLAGGRETVPLDWARTQNNLGNALSDLSYRRSDLEMMKEALVAYGFALEARPRKDVPLDWADTQNSMSWMTATLGQRLGSTKLMRDAITLAELALEERHRELVPLDWATSKTNLADANQALASLLDSAGLYKISVQHYEDALLERPKDTLPIDWASLQNNIGNSFTELGVLENDAKWFDKAIAAFEGALELQKRENAPIEWARLQRNLGQALTFKGKLTKNTTLFAQAIAKFKLAELEWSRTAIPFNWAVLQANSGRTQLDWSELDQQELRLKLAISAFQDASEFITKDNGVTDWVKLQDDLGWALKSLGALQKDLAVVRAGRAALVKAEAMQISLGVPTRDHFTKRLKEVDQAIAALE